MGSLILVALAKEPSGYRKLLRRMINYGIIVRPGYLADEGLGEASSDLDAAVEALIPDTRTAVSDSGRALLYEQVDHVVRLVKGFLR